MPITVLDRIEAATEGTAGPYEVGVLASSISPAAFARVFEQ